MRGLTICQPHAYFIVADPAELATLGIDELTPKRVENRRRPIGYRGPLLIHAGVSRKFLDSTGWDSAALMPRLVFGAILGICDLVDCVSVHRVLGSNSVGEGAGNARVRQRYPWLESHYHTFGPRCLILANVRRFREPIPWRGLQCLWNPASSIGYDAYALRQAIEQAVAVSWDPNERRPPRPKV